MAEYVLIATCVAALVHRARLITYETKFKNFTNDQALHFCHQFLKNKKGSQQLIRDLWNRNRSSKRKALNGPFKDAKLNTLTDVPTICRLAVLGRNTSQFKTALEELYRPMQIKCIEDSLNELLKHEQGSVVSFTEIPNDLEINVRTGIQIFRYKAGGVALAIKTTNLCKQTNPTVDKKRRRDARYFKVACGNNVYVAFHLPAGRKSVEMDPLKELIKEDLENTTTTTTTTSTTTTTTLDTGGKNIILLGDGNGHLNSTKSFHETIRFIDFGSPTGHGATECNDAKLGIDVIGSNDVAALDELKPLKQLKYTFSTTFPSDGKADGLNQLLEIDGLSDHKRLICGNDKDAVKYIIASNLGYKKIYDTAIFRIGSMSIQDQIKWIEVLFNLFDKCTNTSGKE